MTGQSVINRKTASKSAKNQDRDQLPEWAANLEPREYRFVLTYLQCLNGTKAALAAGYAASGAHVRATEVLSRPRVQKVIAAAMEGEFGITKARLAEEFGSFAFAKAKDQIVKDWGLRPSDKLSAGEKLAKLLRLQVDQQAAPAMGSVVFMIVPPGSEPKVIDGQAEEVAEPGGAQLLIGKPNK